MTQLIVAEQRNAGMNHLMKGKVNRPNQVEMQFSDDSVHNEKGTHELSPNFGGGIFDMVGGTL